MTRCLTPAMPAGMPFISTEETSGVDAALASRDIESGRIDGTNQPADNGPVVTGLQPGIFHLPLMEGLDTFDGPAKGFQKPIVDLLVGLLQFLGTDPQLLGASVPAHRICGHRPPPLRPSSPVPPGEYP